MRLLNILFIILAVVPVSIVSTTNHTLACEKGKCKRRCPGEPHLSKRCSMMKAHKSDCIKIIHKECDRCVLDCMYPRCRKECLKNIGSPTCAAEKRPGYAPLPGRKTCAHYIIQAVITCDMDCYVGFLRNQTCTSLCHRLEDIVK